MKLNGNNGPKNARKLPPLTCLKQEQKKEELEIEKISSND